ncbi:MAG: excinuclease ABC subunit UvrC [Candidatus Riflebacteria bacterium]|nr:excinuclease ABC subunit UvrC [Candidatus Riflebacteria bacterium]
MSKYLEEKLAKLPLSPGVYIMKDAKKEIIYIGKSRSLKKRVSSYFARSHSNLRTKIMVSKIADFEYIVTANEVEALILENNLIKKYRPHYNVLLKDNKTYPYIMITLSEPIPRIKKARKVNFKDGNLYFGPYPSAFELTRVIDYLSVHFKLCTSKQKNLVPSDRRKPCLRYHLDYCDGLCANLIARETYLESLNKAIDIISGKERFDFSALKAEIGEKAAEFRYEEAAELRDLLEGLTNFFESQIVEFLKPLDLDFWGVASANGKTAFSILLIRGGKLLGKRAVMASGQEETISESLSAVMRRFYDSNLVPRAIFVSEPPEDAEALAQMFTEVSGYKTEIRIPKRGKYKKLMTTADENALETLQHIASAQTGRIDDAVVDLQSRLNLPVMPIVIECIDISHIQGVDPVAALVVMENAQLKKKEYRKYHIKTAKGGDDPASIAEVTRRRFERLIAEDYRLPDLFLVDGGITQVRAALREVEKLGLAVKVLGLAERNELFVDEAGNEIKIPFSSPGMRKIILLRNEAHRFANTFQNKTHTKRTLGSSLLKLPGVGPITFKKLMAAFGSISAIAKADAEEIAARASIPRKTAELVSEALKSSETLP